ncbi:hypothetical protein CRH09_39950 (plasmid) [Nocardia terpenica]|uniref:DUF8175 domain-containing protein n=2 Tax=Nocardia terpenica TaxID=455432 RepID=A0A291RYY5_9NOCA|nr:hypothetical protein CRH09_39950 [Nocardia terpenica]
MALIAAVVFVAVLIAAGTIVLVTRGGDDHGAKPTAPPTPSSAPPGPGTATGFGIPETDPFGRRIDMPNNAYGQPLEQTAPHREPGDPEWLTAAPAGTRGPGAKGGWQRVYGAVVPFSASDGPTRIQDGVPTGYAHTPQGAALAAAFLMWETAARPADRPLRERMVVMSANDLAEFDRLKAAGKLPDRRPDSETRYMLAPDAFRIRSWADDLCVVELATRTEPDKTGTPRWLGNQLAMVWDGSGWRMRLAADQKLPQEALASLAGWTPW